IEGAGVRSGSCRVGSFARDGFGVVGPKRARLPTSLAGHAELGTVRGSVRYLRPRGILLGVRPEACPGTIRNMLRHPVYVGAYANARFPTDRRRKALGESKTGRREAEPSEWKVLIKDHLPAYITWEQQDPATASRDDTYAQPRQPSRPQPCGHDR